MEGAEVGREEHWTTVLVWHLCQEAGEEEGRGGGWWGRRRGREEEVWGGKSLRPWSSVEKVSAQCGALAQGYLDSRPLEEMARAWHQHQTQTGIFCLALGGRLE